MAHDHVHDHVHHGNGQHNHHHAPGQPHPAQMASWSILRMPLVLRLAIAVGLSVGLWAIVLLAMR